MVSKFDINPKTGKQYGINPATGVQDDNYWAQVVEPRLKQAGGPNYEDPVQKLIQTTIDEYGKKADEYTKKYNEFEKNNPFVFDQVLGEEKAKVAQRLDPYYEQTLGDFLTGVSLKRQRGIEDERTLLTELQQDTDKFTGNQKLQLTDAIEKSREGAADAGLYSSGAALREQGRLEQQSGQTLSDALTTADRKKKEIETNQQRNTQDLNLEQTQKTRDLKQEQTYQTESQALPEVQRRQQQREFERGQYTGAYAGVDPNQFQSQLYGMLK